MPSLPRTTDKTSGGNSSPGTPALDERKLSVSSDCARGMCAATKSLIGRASRITTPVEPARSASHPGATIGGTEGSAASFGVALVSRVATSASPARAVLRRTGRER